MSRVSICDPKNQVINLKAQKSLYNTKYQLIGKVI
jgi:hypothetical protein